MALDGISGFCAKVRNCRGSPADAHLGANNNLCSEPERERKNSKLPGICEYVAIFFVCDLLRLRLRWFWHVID